MNEAPLFDFEHDEVYLSSMQYLFVRAQGEEEALLTEGCVSFVTQSGFFAALGHNEDPEVITYEGAEMYVQDSEEAEPEQAGRVLRSAPSGVYGAFYDDYAPSVFARLKVAPLDSLKADTPAELWVPVGKGEPSVFKGEIVALFPDKPHPVLFEVRDERFPGAQFGCSGSVVVQDGKIVAVVAGANENPATLLYCTSAEQMTIDLYRMLYELAAADETEDGANE